MSIRSKPYRGGLWWCVEMWNSLCSGYASSCLPTPVSTALCTPPAGSVLGYEVVGAPWLRFKLRMMVPFLLNLKWNCFPFPSAPSYTNCAIFHAWINWVNYPALRLSFALYTCLFFNLNHSLNSVCFRSNYDWIVIKWNNQFVLIYVLAYKFNDIAFFHPQKSQMKSDENCSQTKHLILMPFKPNISNNVCTTECEVRNEKKKKTI